MKLETILEEYEVGFRHNPKQFYGNSFQVETVGKKLVLVAVVKRHVGKKFRVVGIVKRKRC